MSLNKEFFDNIQIELVKRKYYNADKIDALMAEIRREAQSMSEENSRLSQQLETLNAQKSEISEAVMSAQLICSDILQKANLRSEELISQAEAKAADMLVRAQTQADDILSRAKAQEEEILGRISGHKEKAEEMAKELESAKQHRQEYAVESVEKCFARLRQHYIDSIDALNSHWQDFLCGLYDEAEPTAPTATVSESSGAEKPSETEAMPADLGEKLDALAKELDDLKV